MWFKIKFFTESILNHNSGVPLLYTVAACSHPTDLLSPLVSYCTWMLDDTKSLHFKALCSVGLVIMHGVYVTFVKFKHKSSLIFDCWHLVKAKAMHFGLVGKSRV